MTIILMLLYIIIQIIIILEAIFIAVVISFDTPLMR